MLLKEKLKYDIKVSGINAKININYDEKNMNLVYACYFSKDGVNIEKRNYQKSNEFIFKCDGNGIYRFVVFVKETDTQNLNGGGGQEQNKIWHQTETFEVKNYNIGVIAHEEVIDIIDSNENFFIFRSDSNFKFKDEVKYVFLDVPYIAEKFIIQNKIDVAENIIDIIRKFSQEYEEVILLDGYFKNQDEINDIVLYVVMNCNFGNVDVINHCQILEKVDGKIVYESYNRFKRVVLNGINDFIEKSLKRPIENTWVEIALNGNVLISEIINREIDKLKNVKYFFYVLKDGAVYYKSEVWLDDNKLSLELNENGIYCVQGYIKSNEISFNFKSHTVEYFTEDYREKFGNFLNNNSYAYDTNDLEFYRCGNPFEDFAVIQSKNLILEDFSFNTLKNPQISNEEQLKFYSLGEVGEYNRYAISSKEPYERNEVKIIFSGIISDKSKVLFGEECLEFLLNNKIDSKYNGAYSLAVIDKDSIRLSNDFFNFNRLFYYCDSENIICSNRYHMLLLILKNLGIEVSLNEEKALLTLSSANIQFLTQNTISEMDIKCVYKCVNICDIVLDKNGFNLVENDYGKVLNDSSRVSENQYREMLYEGKREITENINSILDNEKFKNIITDLTGGLDSRIVYGNVLQNQKNKNKISINSYAVAGSKDLDIAIKINSIYNLKWDTTNVEKSTLNYAYSDKMQRSFYMGIYYSHNPVTVNNKAESTVKMIGACGEILLRPYIVRKYFNTQLGNIKSKEEFLDYILRDYGAEIITDYNAAKQFINLHLKEFENYKNCSNFEKIDRIYLEHRHGYHFDQGIMSKHGIFCLMPLQSKKLFELHHKIYDKHRSIKLELDFTNILDPYLSSIEYDDDRDNYDKEYIKDLLYYDKDYYRNINLDRFTGDTEEYDKSIIEKRKNTKSVKVSYDIGKPIDFSYKILCDLRYICNNNKTLRERVGIALYYYINNEKNRKNKNSIRYLYNKIESLSDQMKIFKK